MSQKIKWWLQRVFLEDKKGCTKIKTKKSQKPFEFKHEGVGLAITVHQARYVGFFKDEAHHSCYK
jgi:hypothetical protein